MVRAAAIGALARIGVLELDELLTGLGDVSAVVRLRAITEAAHRPGPGSGPVDRSAERALVGTLVAQLDIPETAEAAIWALGERPDTEPSVVDRLMVVATDHDNPLCREAAVAALGSIGDPRSLPAVLTASTDKANVRRRAIIALAAFEGDEVEGRLRDALTDRDWQVRQVAEDLCSIGADRAESPESNDSGGGSPTRPGGPP
jgi:HEAT repeat protein